MNAILHFIAFIKDTRDYIFFFFFFGIKTKNIFEKKSYKSKITTYKSET